MILVFSDLHANKKAAQFIERLAKDATEIICCGDICGYGEDFKYCIDTLKAIGAKSVLGNHDYMVISNYDMADIVPWVSNPILKTRELIGEDEIEYLKGLPMSLETPSGLYVTHTFGIDQYINNEADCSCLINSTDKKIIAFGHTHVLAEYHIGDVTLINPGSISSGRLKTKPSYIMLDNGVVITREIERWI